MNPKKRTARIAGTLYLLMAFTGMFGILYAPSQIIVAGDAGTTAQNIMANEMLFRLGILSQLACQVLFVYLVLSLYRLLKEVNGHYAKQMVALVIVAVPMAFLNMLNQVAALVLLSDADLSKVFEPAQLHALVMTFLTLYEQGVIIVQIFWGLWLIPFGLLVYQSVFIPRIFGILLVIGGAGYVVASFTGLTFPHYGAVVGSIATLPSAIGEFAIIFWLLIKGVKESRPAATHKPLIN